MERREPPETAEGWYVLHDLRTIDWDAWRTAPERDREVALAEGIEYLRSYEDVVDAEEGGSAVFHVLGHEADLMVVHLRPTTAHLDRAERQFEQTAFADFTERATSYVSVTEMSGYVHEDVANPEEIEDAGMRNYVQQRLHPSIPDVEHVCFYPMDKRRGPEHNWYDLSFEERAELMSGHGDIGREYAGKVTQFITGSVGFDDYEWGVTLFADDPTDIKHLLYEMRFDPSSSKYAEFGPFYFGRRFDPRELPDLLAGDPIGTGVEPEEVSTTRAHAHAEVEVEEEAVERAEESAEAETEAEAGDETGGRPPQAQGEAPHEETTTDELRQELKRIGLEDVGDAGYGLVFYSDADADELMEEVEGLRGNFDHYDTHERTVVRAEAGRSAVVSLWANERAADTASGFLADLPGVEEGIGAPLEPAAAGERPDEAREEEQHANEPLGGEDDIRGELADLDIYAGQPHGEDVYALVLYSEADPEELEAEVTDLREGFDRYDTHVKTDVYEAGATRSVAERSSGDAEPRDQGRDRLAVVSLWETEDAADTASGYLSDLPGIVGRAGQGPADSSSGEAASRAGEESGFGTMGMFYTVKPEHREDFVERFETVGELLEDTEGHLETDLMVNREDENDMFIASQWASKEDALAFFRSDAFRDTVQWGREVLADRPRHVFLA